MRETQYKRITITTYSETTTYYKAVKRNYFRKSNASKRFNPFVRNYVWVIS